MKLSDVRVWSTLRTWLLSKKLGVHFFMYLPIIISNFHIINKQNSPYLIILYVKGNYIYFRRHSCKIKALMHQNIQFNVIFCIKSQIYRAFVVPLLSTERLVDNVTENKVRLKFISETCAVPPQIETVVPHLQRLTSSWG